ncbi:hypothetical protein B0T24DRAFT_94387 [Lasiosphaeria ovina]|uniref:Uncharacterized protein n=1 Tax=Lasiosphaeria ovina TaxID=92902 RepID=A0AAE0NNA0_9PEZI|nr:hypothetical protein B0T24DRAFT_94387 [Lasiosphaeria ovina]
MQAVADRVARQLLAFSASDSVSRRWRMRLCNNKGQASKTTPINPTFPDGGDAALSRACRVWRRSLSASTTRPDATRVDSTRSRCSDRLAVPGWSSAAGPTKRTTVANIKRQRWKTHRGPRQMEPPRTSSSDVGSDGTFQGEIQGPAGRRSDGTGFMRSALPRQPATSIDFTSLHFASVMQCSPRQRHSGRRHLGGKYYMHRWNCGCVAGWDAKRKEQGSNRRRHSGLVPLDACPLIAVQAVTAELGGVGPLPPAS